MAVNTFAVAALLSICFSLIHAQSFFLTPGGISSNYVNVKSQWYKFRASEEPAGDVIMTLSSPTGNVDFDPSELVFDSDHLEQTFRITPISPGFSTVVFSLSGNGSAGWTVFPDFSDFLAVRKPVTVDPFPQTLFIDVPTEQLEIRIQHPSTGDLVFSATPSQDGFKITPDTVVIPAGQISGFFTVEASVETNTFTTFNWNISGDEAVDYAIPASSVFNVVRRDVYMPSYSPHSLVGPVSTVLYAYTPVLPNTTLEVTPVAVDSVFDPPTLTFTSDQQVVSFTVSTSSPISKNIYYYEGGDDEPRHNPLFNGLLSVSLRSFNVEVPDTLISQRLSHMSIQINAPVHNNVTVSFAASNIVFNPSSVTFSGDMTSAVVEVQPQEVGSATINFVVSGTDKDWYEPVGTRDVTIARGLFISANNWYVPRLFVGVKSPEIPVRINVPPTQSVVLTPSCPDMTFEPAQLEFTSDRMQQYFRMIPAPSNTDNDQPVQTFVTVDFLVSGPDQNSYFAPPSFNVAVARRTVQIVWSSHLERNSGSNVLYLNKKYYVTASVNYPPESELTVTPVNPHMKFEPSVLRFSSSVKSVDFSVQVTGVTGFDNIQYMIGGENGGHYLPISQTSVMTALRPLDMHQVVVSPREDVPGVGILNPTTTDLTANHVFSFALRTMAIPDGEVTITPRSHQIEFEPSSITLKSGSRQPPYTATLVNRPEHVFQIPYLMSIANFTCKPISPGTHEVWIELSGEERDYYERPNHFDLRFTAVEHRDKDDANHISAAVPVYTSFSLIAAVFCALFVFLV